MKELPSRSSAWNTRQFMPLCDKLDSTLVAITSRYTYFHALTDTYTYVNGRKVHANLLAATYPVTAFTTPAVAALLATECCCLLACLWTDLLSTLWSSAVKIEVSVVPSNSATITNSVWNAVYCKFVAERVRFLGTNPASLRVWLTCEECQDQN